MSTSDEATSQTSHTPPGAEAIDALTIVASRGGDGMGVTLKVDGANRVFRIEPVRDPNQPRFWCLRVYRCTSAGMVEQSERSWWGGAGMTRADLPTAIAAIRDHPAKWLAGRDRAELRNWILGRDEPPASQ